MKFLVFGTLQLAFLAFVSCDDPSVIISGTDPPLDHVEGIIIQHKTKDVQLMCTVENKPEDSDVQWTMRAKDGLEVQISTATRSFDAYKWAIDKPTSTAWRLRVQNVGVSDEGIYTCKVSVSQQNYNTDSRELRVIELPIISDLLTSNDMSKSDGDSATLECYATGRPEPVITWSRLAGELLPSGGTEFRGNTLVIDPVQYADAGDYKCTASNSAGFMEKKIRLTVNFYPRVLAANPLVRQKVGYPKVLVCDIKGYPQPSPEAISWTHNSRPVMTDDRHVLRHIAGAYNKIRSALVIKSVQESDFGDYRCAAVNDEGTGYADMRLQPSDTVTDTQGYYFGSAPSLSSSIVSIVLMAGTVWLLQRLEWRQ